MEPPTHHIKSVNMVTLCVTDPVYVQFLCTGDSKNRKIKKSAPVGGISSRNSDLKKNI